MKNVIMGASTQISGFSPSAEHKATQSNERKIAVSCHIASGNSMFCEQGECSSGPDRLGKVTVHALNRKQGLVY